ncbi:uncharacterized protein LOC125488369 [Rhincodon typus]|uniref:uncharacterized protein LOC125488369 n=1 Tax=Rhincodon typus TaxID=259920 RepID=UPI00202ED539|nr:uncharacterized protein LOC125488369 [Rhincodon typus]
MELGAKLSEVQRQNASLRCERQALERKQSQLQARLDSTSGTVLYLSRQLKAEQNATSQAGFCLASVKSSARSLRFYTGFENYAKFDAFLRFVTQDAGLCAGKIRGQPAHEGPEGGAHGTLSHGDQLLLVLARLRLGLLLQDLAFRFRVSETTVSRVWLNWTDVIRTRLLQIPVTCSLKYIQSFEPKRVLKHQGGETLTLLDCTDLIFEAQAKDRGARPRGLFRPYRSHYSRCGYVVVSQSGYLTFASGPAAGEEAGEEEDEEEEEEEGGGPGAAEEGGGRAGGVARMKLPEFFFGGSLTDEQRSVSRQVLSIRSHVDKVLSFRFLRSAHPRTMETQVDRAWTICCYLACLNHKPMGLE